MKRAWHIGITVSDIEKSIHFYRDILGLKLLDGPSEACSGEVLEKGLGVPGAEVVIAKFEYGESNDHLELLQYNRPKPNVTGPFLPNTPGTAHYAFQVEDVMEKVTELKAKGVGFLSDPIIGGKDSASSTAGWRWVYFLDPDGYMLELVDYDPTQCV